MSAHAFTVPGRGPALRVTDRLVTPLWRPSPSPRFPLDLDLPRLPRVDVVPVYPGADGLFIRSSLAAGAAGVVVEAVGAGNAGPELVEAVAEAVAAGHPVLICSRVHSGPVAPSTRAAAPNCNGSAPCSPATSAPGRPGCCWPSRALSPAGRRRHSSAPGSPETTRCPAPEPDHHRPPPPAPPPAY